RDRLAFGDRELGAALAAHAPGPPARPRDCRLNMTKAQYLGRLERVKRHIVDGDTYQVNYTLKYKFRHEGAPLALFAALRERQRVEYGAYLDFPGLTVLSRSPELFFEKRGGRARTRPIKGTAGRGTTPAADRRRADALAADPKARAENVMIVDLLRNDLSRVGRPGTVEASDLFAIETYATLHQMVSTVSARVDEGLSLSDVLRHLFPCGSITGAPKVRTMELIRELEVEPRGVYTGAIGHLSPDGSMCFNVAIRTLALRPDGSGEMGVGGGIVHDSDPEAEYEECRLKGRFLTGDEPERPPTAPTRGEPGRSPLDHDALEPPPFEHHATEPSPLERADGEAPPPPPP
ncbi:MAG TPA: aminodeoxychorismate synthase component I, partial [Polyangiaceae bacterium]|nr:aminodeoxychorismate synthase component I [Polyangiaceae bacterium]